MSKYEWRKSDKHIYLAKTKPTLITLSETKYITVEGVGNPNGELFSQNIQALYSIAYGIKMLPKKSINVKDYYEYTVFPLEGLWDLTDKGKQSKILNKDELVYKLMIRQPDFLNEDLFDQIKSLVLNKTNNENINKVNFEILNDGKCVQMLHIGSFDDEQRTFDIINNFIEEKKLIKTDLRHKEIYLSDFRKTSTDKLKTVLRCFVK
ncbi:MAG: GyrI-like domain-containing protein [Mycoplasma sp.]